jgi:hypothetical protein
MRFIISDAIVTVAIVTVVMVIIVVFIKRDTRGILLRY